MQALELEHEYASGSRFVRKLGVNGFFLWSGAAFDSGILSVYPNSAQALSFLFPIFVFLPLSYFTWRQIRSLILLLTILTDFCKCTKLSFQLSSIGNKNLTRFRNSFHNQKLFVEYATETSIPKFYKFALSLTFDGNNASICIHACTWPPFFWQDQG